MTFSRTHQERLLEANFLKEVMKGWLMSTRPGDSTSWYSSFWEFCRVYLDDHFGKDWVISAENSVLLLADNLNILSQVVVFAPAASNRTQLCRIRRHLSWSRKPSLTRKRCWWPTCARTTKEAMQRLIEILDREDLVAGTLAARFWSAARGEINKKPARSGHAPFRSDQAQTGRHICRANKAASRNYLPLRSVALSRTS